MNSENCADGFVEMPEWLAVLKRKLSMQGEKTDRVSECNSGRLEHEAYTGKEGKKEDTGIKA